MKLTVLNILSFWVDDFIKFAIGKKLTSMKFLTHNILKHFLFSFLMFIGFSMSLKAQVLKSDSLVFSIDDTPVYKSEFLRQYRKNNQSSISNEKLSIADYADLYLKFKLKVQAAKNQGLDTMPEFVNEYKNYRKQLADKYISNGKVTDDMVKETYHRMVNEVNVSHILIDFKPDAKPEDTLKAYNASIDILKMIDEGESFENLAVKFSKDPSVKNNKGNLGWFKFNKMAYPFETAAYKLDINEVSEPVRTKYGYHIILKNDERPSRGKLKVAHIMKSIKSKDSTYNAENEIQKIYQKLQDDESFENLAKQFSDHKPTASSGGLMSPFGVGQINSAKFEEVAFSLDAENAISKPFKTQFGWHIVKYIDEIPVKPLDDIKKDIIREIKTTKRSARLIENIKVDLMTKYEVETNYEVLSTLIDRIDESLLKSKWNYEPQESDNQTWILKIDNKAFMLDEFLNYIQKQQRLLKPKDIEGKVNAALDKFTYAKLIKSHNLNLENASPEFAAEIKTYFEGLLLFEIMENKIWKPTQEDSLALQKYFKDHPDKFMSEISIDGVLASSSAKKSIKKIKKDIDEDSIEVLRENYPEVIFKTLNQTEIQSSDLPQEIKLEINKPKIYEHNGQFLCLYITEIYPKKPLEFNIAKGKVINLLQKQREQDWIADLMLKHDIFINTDLINKLQQKFEN